MIGVKALDIDISIIVPVYNVAKYLQKSLESILSQTKKEFELIIVNDGSTDDSPVILNEFAKRDNRIKMLNQKNSGVSVARNKGLSVATGKYILFLDADDYIENDMLQKLYDAIEVSKADAAICDHIEETEEGVVLKCFYNNLPTYKMNKDELNQKVLYDLIGYANEANLKKCTPISGSLCTILFRKDFIKKEGILFSSELFRAEDLLFKIEYFCAAQSIIAVKKPLYHYVRRRDSATMSYNPRIFQNSKKYLALLGKILLKYGYLDECKKRVNIKAFTLITFMLDYLCKYGKKVSFIQKREIILRVLYEKEFSAALSKINGYKLSFIQLLRFICYKNKLATIILLYHKLKYWRA